MKYEHNPVEEMLETKQFKNKNFSAKKLFNQAMLRSSRSNTTLKIARSERPELTGEIEIHDVDGARKSKFQSPRKSVILK